KIVRVPLPIILPTIEMPEPIEEAASDCNALPSRDNADPPSPALNLKLPIVARFRPSRKTQPRTASSCVTLTSNSSPTFYYESKPGRRSAAKLLTKDEARRIAVNRQAAGTTEVATSLALKRCH